MSSTGIERLYLYCATRASLRPPGDLRGLAGAPVATVVAGDLAVWVTPLGSNGPEASIDAIRAHNQVVEAAVTPTVTPIPLRFGQRLDSADEVRDLIDREREAWLELLAVFAGCMEFGLRVADPSRERAAQVVRPDARAGGRQYLEQLAKRHVEERGAGDEAERVAARAREVLGDAIRRERVEPLRTTHGIATIAHLVERGRFEEYQNRVAAVRESLPALKFLASGPWPPYSFVA